MRNRIFKKKFWNFNEILNLDDFQRLKKTIKKLLFMKIVYFILYRRCLGNNIFFSFGPYLLLAPPDNVLSLLSNFKKKAEIESNFLNTSTAGLKLNHYLVQWGVDPMIQFGLFNRCGWKVTFNFIWCYKIHICGT